MAGPVPARRAVPQRAPHREQRRPDLRVVRSRTRARRPRRGVIVGGALVVVFGALLASAVFHALLAQGQQRLDHTDQKVSQAQDRYDRLRLELDRLSAPARIVNEAHRLGMVQPDSVQTVTPPPGAGEAVPDVAGAVSSDPALTGTGYTTVKPYLGADR